MSGELGEDSITLKDCMVCKRMTSFKKYDRLEFGLDSIPDAMGYWWKCKNCGWITPREQI